METVLGLNSSFAEVDTNFVIQVITAIVCGAIIGSERKIKSKPIGVRTSILICMGTMIFVKYSLLIASSESITADPTRVIGQVVTGIGFLGAGAIMNKDGLVKGLTSAATIWVQAAIGVLIGCNYLIDAILFTIITWIILYLGNILEKKLVKPRKKSPKVTLTN